MLQKGNIVKFKCGFWGDVNAPETNRLGVIEYSYGERYGDGKVSGGYSVLDKETGSSSAWWDEDKLEFVNEGSENEITLCKQIAQEIKTQNEDLNYIRDRILKTSTLSSTSILKLFHEIGYVSSFERNGEYFCLWGDWECLYPIFVAIFKQDYDAVIEAASVFKAEYREKYKANIIDFYNRINQEC